MTGEEHYAEAERLTERAANGGYPVEREAAIAALATAHATLAIAQFTARTTPGVRLGKETPAGFGGLLG